MHLTKSDSVTQVSQNENEIDPQLQEELRKNSCSWGSHHPTLSEWLHSFESNPAAINLWARTESASDRMTAWLHRWQLAGHPDLGDWPLGIGSSWDRLEQSLPTFTPSETTKSASVPASSNLASENAASQDLPSNRPSTPHSENDLTFSEYMRTLSEHPEFVPLWANTECSASQLKTLLDRWKQADFPDLGSWPSQTEWEMMVSRDFSPSSL